MKPLSSLILVIIALNAWSQVQLSGKIIEEETGIAVPNAYVFLENTKYGVINTDHILFISAGAFHYSKPSDLIPELQGRFRAVLSRPMVWAPSGRLV